MAADSTLFHLLTTLNLNRPPNVHFSYHSSQRGLEIKQYLLCFGFEQVSRYILALTTGTSISDFMLTPNKARIIIVNTISSVENTPSLGRIREQGCVGRSSGGHCSGFARDDGTQFYSTYTYIPASYRYLFFMMSTTCSDALKPALPTRSRHPSPRAM